MKKLAIASAIALMGLGAAHAATEIALDISQIGLTPQPQIAGVFQAGAATDAAPIVDALSAEALESVTGLLANFTSTVDGEGLTVGPQIGVLSGAINLARINGAIDISGTNVSLASLANNVSATATATATTSTADAYAIAGAKLSTTVIGSMNSATVEVMGKVTDQTNSLGQKTGLGSLAMTDGGANIATTGIEAALASLGDNTAAEAPNLGNEMVTADLLTISDSTGQIKVDNLTSDITSNTTNKISELQNMAVFNTAINLGALDAGIKVVASVDPTAWFLNPQTGVVNLSNVAMATTAIGAMNSGVTRLGANLSPTVTVK